MGVLLHSKSFLTSWEFPFVHIFTHIHNSYYMLRICLILCYIVLCKFSFMNNKIFACLLEPRTTDRPPVFLCVEVFAVMKQTYR